MVTDFPPVDDYGYDPTLDEDATLVQWQGPAPPPTTYVISASSLPPVGTQGTAGDPGSPPSCAAWASTYGVATAAAALAGGYAPTTPKLQASPASIYIQVTGVSAAPCKGSQLMSYFKVLAASGTPNLNDAPYYPNCSTLVKDYYNPITPPPNDSDFQLSGVTAVKTLDTLSIKHAICANHPLAYGTRLYTDWRAYKGDPVPYVGNGMIAKTKKGKPVGHCMMIIGYDDSLGAFRIQNSEGTSWGDAGLIWMAYTTFQTLAQGTAFFYV